MDRAANRNFQLFKNEVFQVNICLPATCTMSLEDRAGNAIDGERMFLQLGGLWAKYLNDVLPRLLCLPNNNVDALSR